MGNSNLRRIGIFSRRLPRRLSGCICLPHIELKYAAKTPPRIVQNKPSEVKSKRDRPRASLVSHAAPIRTIQASRCRWAFLRCETSRASGVVAQRTNDFSRDGRGVCESGFVGGHRAGRTSRSRQNSEQAAGVVNWGDCRGKIPSRLARLVEVGIGLFQSPFAQKNARSIIQRNRSARYAGAGDKSST